jgi:DnaJ-class molecular chaperone
MADKEKCPVCEGRGTMPGAFYGDPRPVVTCRSCGGTTVVEAAAVAPASPAEYAPTDLTGS